MYTEEQAQKMKQLAEFLAMVERDRAQDIPDYSVDEVASQMEMVIQQSHRKQQIAGVMMEQKKLEYLSQIEAHAAETGWVAPLTMRTRNISLI